MLELHFIQAVLEVPKHSIDTKEGLSVLMEGKDAQSHKSTLLLFPVIRKGRREGIRHNIMAALWS